MDANRRLKKEEEEEEKWPLILTHIMVCDGELWISNGVCICTALNIIIVYATTACCLSGLTHAFKSFSQTLWFKWGWLYWE